MSWLGIPLAVIGLVYLITIGRRLLPDRKDMLEQLGESPREYLVNMIVQPECRLIGQPVGRAGLRRLPGLFLIEVTRGDDIISPVGPDFVLNEGDRLTFTGVVSNIVYLERIPGLVPAADATYEQDVIQRRARRLCEAVVSATSPLVGKSIRAANFRAVYNAAVVAVHRGGTRLQGRVGDIVLRAGDTLLLQTTAHFAQAHRNNPDFYLVSPVEESRYVRHDRANLALLLLGVLVFLMATGIMPIIMAAFLIAGLMIVTKCISASIARQNVDWTVLLTIVGALGIAQALQQTGAASTIAHTVVEATQPLGPTGALVAVYLITMLFTELITNVAAAALVFPLAIAVASDFGVSPRPFAIAVAFAASASFVTPIGYQTNMMIYGPGGYRFVDYIRVGLPLSLLLCVAAAALIPFIWTF
jgi:di/tricarboxylate transporter